jgi:hypothetical protein
VNKLPLREEKRYHKLFTHTKNPSPYKHKKETTQNPTSLPPRTPSLTARVLHYRRRLLRPGSTTLPLDTGKRSNKSRRRGNRGRRNDRSRQRSSSGSSNGSLGLALLGRRGCCDRRRSRDCWLGSRRDLVGLALLGRAGGAGGAGLLRPPGLALLRGGSWWWLLCFHRRRGRGGLLGSRALGGLALLRSGRWWWGVCLDRRSWRLSGRDLSGLALRSRFLDRWGAGSGRWCL